MIHFSFSINVKFNERKFRTFVIICPLLLKVVGLAPSFSLGLTAQLRDSQRYSGCHRRTRWKHFQLVMEGEQRLFTSSRGLTCMRRSGTNEILHNYIERPGMDSESWESVSEFILQLCISFGGQLSRSSAIFRRSDKPRTQSSPNPLICVPRYRKWSLTLT